MSYSLIIPTHNRPDRLPGAIASALAQTVPPIEVLVVDDASHPPASFEGDPRVRIIRMDRNGGPAAARNAGIAEATGQYVAFLDDDDRLLPHFAEISLEALRTTSMPRPVAVLSAMEVRDGSDRVLQVRRPPTLERGRHFALEHTGPGTSFNSKQTMFIETAVLRSLRGWDEAFRTRETTELFQRLNPVCSIQGLNTATYIQYRHGDARLSTDIDQREPAFRQLEKKHRATLAAHPKGYARMLVAHAARLNEQGARGSAARAYAQAVRAAPLHALRLMARNWLP